MLSEACRYYFDSIESAADGLAIVLDDARNSRQWYRFGGITAEQVLTSGLAIEGEIDVIRKKLDLVIGAVRYDE